MSTGGRMQIGEVAEQIGLSLRTIRYYEEVGLAVPSARSEGGFRLYVESDVERLRVVMQMKPLGFSLEEMTQLLNAFASLADDPTDVAALVFVEHCRRRTEEGRADLVRKLTWADEFSALLAERLPVDGS